MRAWFAVVSLSFALALTAGAQHGAHAVGGGHFAAAGGASHFGGGGFRSAAPFHTGMGAGGHSFAPQGRMPMRFGPGQRVGGSIARGRFGGISGRIGGDRPTFYSRSGPSFNHHGFIDGRGRNGWNHDRLRFYGVPFLYPGVFDTAFLNPYLDPFWGDDGLSQDGDGFYDQGFDAGAPGPYAPDPGQYAEGEQQEAPAAVAEAAPMTNPAIQEDPGVPYLAPRAMRMSAAPRQPLPEEDAVTLIFRDGRPSEQVRNYALTSTSLVISGKRLREIPLTALDLPATERVNRQAGVDFTPPPAP